MSADSPDVAVQLRRHVEEVVELFEPRLSDIRVTTSEAEDLGGRRLRFVIDALLRMEPSPEQVQFDTVLEVSSGKFQVRGDGSA